MARIQYTALVNRIAGSIAGTTFQRNAYGHTIKTKPNTVNKNTQAQAEKKALILSISKNWATLSNNDRRSWAKQAESFPIKSRLNPDSTLNGYNYYMKYNLISKQVSSRAILNNSGVDIQTFLFEYIGITKRGSNLTVKVFAHEISGNFIAYLSMTAPLPASRSSIRANFTYITAGSVINTEGGEKYIQLLTSYHYDQKIGIPIKENSYIGVSVKIINQNLGQIIEIPPQIIQVQ